MEKISKHCQNDNYARAFLDELLNRTLPGERLMGIRSMMKLSGVGRIRLEKILLEMEKQHLIEVKNRSGRYRTQSVPDSPLTFIHYSIVPVMESKKDFTGGIVRSLRENALRNNQSFSLLNAKGIPLDELKSILERNKIHQAFIFSGNEVSESNFIRQCVPYTVSLLPRHTIHNGCELRDSPEMTNMQLKYLFQCNYRRIGYIHNVEDAWEYSPVQLKRLMDYYRIMAENGLKIEPEWVFYSGYNWERFNSCMYQAMKSPRRPEAFIVTGSALKYIYKFCSNNGIAIGKELAIMGCDDIEPDLHPRVTTVTNSPSEIGTMAWQVMQKCLQGENICAFTNLRIVTGETVPHRDLQA